MSPARFCLDSNYSSALNGHCSGAIERIDIFLLSYLIVCRAQTNIIVRQCCNRLVVSYKYLNSAIETDFVPLAAILCRSILCNCHACADCTRGNSRHRFHFSFSSTSERGAVPSPQSSSERVVLARNCSASKLFRGRRNYVADKRSLKCLCMHVPSNLGH